jgi:fructokinase
MISVLGELVVDLIPVTDAGAGPQGTALQYLARPGGNA